MKIKDPIYILLSVIILISCLNLKEETSKTIIQTQSPSKEPTSTTIPTETETPHPTSIYQPTISAFENLLKNVCPTNTPNPVHDTPTNNISDNKILREFAGNYSRSDGFTVYALVLNCDGSFYEITFTDTGSVFIHQGYVEVQDSKIIFKIANRSELHTISYIPLRWGQRKYLISANTDAERFCEAMATETRYGKEPRNEEDIIGLFYLRIGDNKIDVTNLPVLPNGTELCK